MPRRSHEAEPGALARARRRAGELCRRIRHHVRVKNGPERAFVFLVDRRETRKRPLVGDVMQRDVVTLDPSATLDVADGLMRTDRIRHLPIVSDGRLVGLLSRRDLLRAGLSDPPTSERARSPVRDLMATQVFTTLAESTLESAVEMMLLKDVGCLPVVEGERLVGLLTQTDCMRCLADLLRP